MLINKSKDPINITLLRRGIKIEAVAPPGKSQLKKGDELVDNRNPFLSVKEMKKVSQEKDEKKDNKTNSEEPNKSPGFLSVSTKSKGK